MNGVFENVKKNLEKHGFKVSCFDTAKEAADYIDSQVDNKSIGFGGYSFGTRDD